MNEAKIQQVRLQILYSTVAVAFKMAVKYWLKKLMAKYNMSKVKRHAIRQIMEILWFG